MVTQVAIPPDGFFVPEKKKRPFFLLGHNKLIQQTNPLAFSKDWINLRTRHWLIPSSLSRSGATLELMVSRLVQLLVDKKKNATSTPRLNASRRIEQLELLVQWGVRNEPNCTRSHYACSLMLLELVPSQATVRFRTNEHIVDVYNCNTKGGIQH
jgi:hypothetical protein